MRPAGGSSSSLRDLVSTIERSDTAGVPVYLNVYDLLQQASSSAFASRRLSAGARRRP